MNKSNFAPFFIGQKVVYTTGINMPKDSIHTVSDIKQEDCGCWFIGINGTNIIVLEHATHCYCVGCDKYSVGNVFVNGTSWSAKSFRPLEQQKFPLIKLSEIRIKELEKVEQAELIGES